MAESLEIRFHEEMVNIYRNALTQAHYQGDKVLRNGHDAGGLATAKASEAYPLSGDALSRFGDGV